MNNTFTALNRSLEQTTYNSQESSDSNSYYSLPVKNNSQEPIFNFQPQPVMYQSQEINQSQPLVYQSQAEPVMYQSQQVPIIYQSQPIIYQSQQPVIYQSQPPVIYQSQPPVMYQSQPPVMYQSQPPVMYH